MGMGDSDRAVRLSVACDWRHLGVVTVGAAMKNHRVSLVKESLELLRQARAEATNDSNHGWMIEVDEAIVKLELYLNEGNLDSGRIDEILKVLARGLGAILAARNLIQLLNDQ